MVHLHFKMTFIYLRKLVPLSVDNFYSKVFFSRDSASAKEDDFEFCSNYDRHVDPISGMSLESDIVLGLLVMGQWFPVGSK